MPAKLNSEIRQSRPFKSAEQEVFLNILRTADGLMAEVADLLKPHGISATQYNVLRILRGACAGCREGGLADASAPGLSCGDIGQRMITRDPDMTRLLDRLEHRGLIVRERGKADRRMVATRITDAGLKLLEPLDAPMLELHQRQLGHLGKTRLAQLVALLESVRERDGG